MRTIIFNGKGGVGKTSVSAATARRLAAKGHRTMIMSVDTAHSLSDSLNVPLGPEITHVCENLDALELNIVHEMRNNWSTINEYLTTLMVSQGIDDISSEELAIFPGMEMIAALFYILKFKDSGMYDAVVMDTAPTGETLRLLSLPEVSNWYVEKFYKTFKRLLSLARLTVGKMIDFPLPTKGFMDTLDDIKDSMTRVREILEDPKETTIRLVLNPETMSIAETRRSYTYLCLYNKTVEAIIVNKVYPDNIGDFFAEKLEEQAQHIKEIEQSFDQLRQMRAYMMPTELNGPEKLDLLAQMIYDDEDPIEVYSTQSPMRFERDDGYDRLILKMPFVKKEDLELYKGHDGAVIIQTAGQRRTVTLPLVMQDSEMTGAEFSKGNLIIKFKRDTNGQ